ncbi:MAG: hemin-degrading factor [Chthoniobacterales bacterium]
MKTETLTLKERWAEFRENNPKTRIRDAAHELGVSEAELLATQCGETVTRLDGDWKELLKQLPKLGRVMCLTRNDAAVHERFGEFRQIDFFHGMGQVVGPDIDLRLFMSHWQHGFAVTDQTADGERLSLQFFDGYGDAIHKVFLQNESNIAGFGVILDQFRSANQEPELNVNPAPMPTPRLPDSEIDVAGFQQGWLELKDTHAFFPLIQKFRVGREQALRLAPEGHASRLPIASIRSLLERAAERSLPIMVFVGSRGCIQIHTAPVQNIKMFGAYWLNVLDPEFNMHLYLPKVASAWVVKKPTTEGIVTSLELYDANGENSVLFFGKRKPGQLEDENWRLLVAEMEDAQ